MMSQSPAYTILEALLLFQALRSEGVHADSFDRIADQLKTFPIVFEDPAYDADRLNADELRELYLRLLQDEVRRGLEEQVNGENQQHTGANGNLSPSPRTRKAPSPSLPTVHEAARHEHLIPQVVFRLHAGYQEQMVRELQEYESQQAVLALECRELEAALQDEEQQRLSTAASANSPKPSSTTHTQPNVPGAEIPLATLPAAADATLPQAVGENDVKDQATRLSPAGVDATASRDSDQSNSPSDLQRASPSTTLPPTSRTAPGSPRVVVPRQSQLQPQPQPQPQQQQQQQQLRQATASTQTSPAPPLASNTSPYPLQTESTAQTENVPTPQTRQTSQVLPSPPPPASSSHHVAALPPSSRAQPRVLQQTTSTGVQTPHFPPPPHFATQHRAQAALSPVTDRAAQANAMPPTHAAPLGHYQHQQMQSQLYYGRPSTPAQAQRQRQPQPQLQPHAQTRPHAQNQVQLASQTPYAEHRSSHPTPTLATPIHPTTAPQTPVYAHQQAHTGGYMLAPFQITPQDGAKSQQHGHYQHQNQYQHQHQRQHLPSVADQPHVPNQAPYHAPATGPRITAHPVPRQLSNILKVLATPPRTFWKSEYRPSRVVVSNEPARPENEPLSPTHPRLRSPAPSTRSTRSRDARAAEDMSSAHELSVRTRSSRRRPNVRTGSPHSIVSSAADDVLRTRTRSHSASTAAGATVTSDDRPGSRSGVKAEPSTPADMLEDAESTPVPVVATPIPGPRTRNRRGTLQAQAAPHPRRRPLDSPDAGEKDQESAGGPAPRSNMVVAAKNFAKMSATVMNDINSHKHASYFANPVRDKDAPGYSEIVLQPQNLKSIRAAITAGTRAVNAASSALDSPTATPTVGASRASDSVVELERSLDLIPPKAIVNGAQLEKELMRMFANAYLFNPGEDGMALITQEMFRDVEQKLNDWRGTEREAGGIDDDDDSKSKRRKL